MMEDFAIGELAAAVEGRHPKWAAVIVDDAIGIPYLRGPKGFRTLGKGLGQRFRIWVNRCPTNEQRRSYGLNGKSSSWPWRKLRGDTLTACCNARCLLAGRVTALHV
jgi:hypothetical protein